MEEVGYREGITPLQYYTLHLTDSKYYIVEEVGHREGITLTLLHITFN